MTEPQPRVVELENQADVTLRALPGAEDLPRIAVFIETQNPVYFVPDDAGGDPVVQGDVSSEGVSRSGATIEFGEVTGVAGDLSDVAEGAAFAASPPHRPAGSINYPGAVLFGGHQKVT